jgi:hypothetical protein
LFKARSLLFAFLLKLVAIAMIMLTGYDIEAIKVAEASMCR